MPSLTDSNGRFRDSNRLVEQRAARLLARVIGESRQQEDQCKDLGRCEIQVNLRPEAVGGMTRLEVWGTTI